MTTLKQQHVSIERYLLLDLFGKSCEYMNLKRTVYDVKPDNHDEPDMVASGFVGKTKLFGQVVEVHSLWQEGGEWTVQGLAE